jgi:hypothetical protein
MADLTEDEGYELIFNALRHMTQLQQRLFEAATDGERERLQQEMDCALQAFSQLRNQEEMKHFFEKPNNPKLKCRLV